MSKSSNWGTNKAPPGENKSSSDMAVVAMRLCDFDQASYCKSNWEGGVGWGEQMASGCGNMLPVGYVNCTLCEQKRNVCEVAPAPFVLFEAFRIPIVLHFT